MSSSKVSQLIHEVDPYEGFDHQPYEYSVQGWGSEHVMFGQAIATIRPKIIIEVGTWRGRSAIFMAFLAAHFNIDCEIICVDTFLGSAEHWNKNSEFYSHLNRRHGYPTLYYQFLANVCHAGFQHVITPFPISSDGAAEFFTITGVRADLVYLDAGHSYAEVLHELKIYWELVNPGGALMGDDFAETAPGVIQAVIEFSNIIKTPFHRSEEKFLFRKPL